MFWAKKIERENKNKIFPWQVHKPEKILNMNEWKKRDGKEELKSSISYRGS